MESDCIHGGNGLVQARSQRTARTRPYTVAGMCEAGVTDAAQLWGLTQAVTSPNGRRGAVGGAGRSYRWSPLCKWWESPLHLEWGIEVIPNTGPRNHSKVWDLWPFPKRLSSGCVSIYLTPRSQPRSLGGQCLGALASKRCPHTAQPRRPSSSPRGCRASVLGRSAFTQSRCGGDPARDVRQGRQVRRPKTGPRKRVDHCSPPRGQRVRGEKNE